MYLVSLMKLHLRGLALVGIKKEHSGRGVTMRDRDKMSQSTCLQRCSFLFPPLLNKFFYFYIVCNGSMGECGGHENTVKTHEIGGVNFNLKGQSRPGPTKLSIALGTEGCHRGS